MRVQILKDFVKQHFTATQLLDYALDVEKITTSKVSLCPSCTAFTDQSLPPLPSLQGFVFPLEVFSVTLPSLPGLHFVPAETQPDPERGWFHWRRLRGPSQDVRRLHKVNCPTWRLS